MLFVSNFIPATFASLEGCMTWGSYVCVELQLFLALPFLLLTYKLRPWITYTIFLLLFVVGTGCCGYILFSNKILPGYLFPFDYEINYLYGNKPYTRINSYAAGVLMGLYY